MKYALDFNINFKDITGADVRGDSKDNTLVLGRKLAELIFSSPDQNNNALKLYGICQELYKNGTIEVDKVDLDMLRCWVENRTDLVVGFKSALLSVFENKIEIS